MARQRTRAHHSWQEGQLAKRRTTGKLLVAGAVAIVSVVGSDWLRQRINRK